MFLLVYVNLMLQEELARLNKIGNPVYIYTGLIYLSFEYPLEIWTDKGGP